jgi:hypothetical protein
MSTSVIGPPPVRKLAGSRIAEPPEPGFPGTYPLELLRTFKPDLDFNEPAEGYKGWWLREARRQSEERDCTNEIEGLLATGRSNGRHTEWAVMDIRPFSAFTLHAHAVSKLIFIIVLLE